MPWVEKDNENSIWPNKWKKNEKAPDYTGTIKLDPMIVQALANQHKAGEEMRISVAIWDRKTEDKEDKGGPPSKPYRYTKISEPRKSEAKPIPQQESQIPLPWENEEK